MTQRRLYCLLIVFPFCCSFLFSQTTPRVYSHKKHGYQYSIKVFSDSTFIFEAKKQEKKEYISSNYEFAKGKIIKTGDSTYAFRMTFRFGFYKSMNMWQDTISVFINDSENKPVDSVTVAIFKSSGRSIKRSPHNGAVKWYVGNSPHVSRAAIIKFYIMDSEISNLVFDLNEKSDADVLLERKKEKDISFYFNEEKIILNEGGFLGKQGQEFNEH